MTQEQTAAFDRLRQIDWAATGQGPFDQATYMLFFEYVGTAKAICERHGLQGGLYQKLSGLFGFVEHLARDAAPALPETVVHWCTHDLAQAYRWRSIHYIMFAAQGFVLWGGLPLEIRQHITGDDLAPNPYTHLITFLERGGAFTCEHNMLDRVFPEPDSETLAQWVDATKSNEHQAKAEPPM